MNVIILHIANKWWAYSKRDVFGVHVPLPCNRKRFYKVFDTEQEAVDYIYG
jgi:hypothetical protein